MRPHLLSLPLCPAARRQVGLLCPDNTPDITPKRLRNCGSKPDLVRQGRHFLLSNQLLTFSQQREADEHSSPWYLCFKGLKTSFYREDPPQSHTEKGQDTAGKLAYIPRTMEWAQKPVGRSALWPIMMRSSIKVNNGNANSLKNPNLTKQTENELVITADIQGTLELDSSVLDGKKLEY